MHLSLTNHLFEVRRVNGRQLEIKLLKYLILVTSLKCLTIENFDFETLRAKAFESKKSGDFTYFAIPYTGVIIPRF